MIIDTNFFSCVTCDAPEAWQTALSKPASITMEGILIFKHHLLFLLIVITLFVCWLLYNGIFFYDKFVHSKGLVCSAIPETYLKKGNFYFKENFQITSPIKKKSTWDPIQARFKIYNLIFIMLLLVSIHYSLLFVTCYVTIGYIYYLKSHWCETHPDKNSNFNWIRKLKDKINESFDLLQFYITEYKIVLLFISLFFSIYRQNYVLTVYFIIFLAFSYSKKIELPQIFLDKIASLKQDFETVRVHKKNDFKIVTDWLNVTWFTLLVTFLLSPVVRSSGIPEILYFTNATLWFFCFEATLLINLVVEVYIILYANMPVADKALVACAKCIATAVVVTTAHQVSTEAGYLEPNEASNRIRTTFSQKPAINTAGDAAIDTEFRRMGVPEDNYTTPRESKYGGKPMNYVDTVKVGEVLKDPTVKQTMTQTGSHKAKVAVGIIKPRQSYFSGWWTER